MTNSTKKTQDPTKVETETLQPSKLSLTLFHFDGTSTACGVHDNHSTIYETILAWPSGMKGIAFYTVGICSNQKEG